MLNRALILIVEDEPIIGLELQASIEDAGGLVIGPVGSASAALILLETCIVAAAILDVHLTDRDVTPVAEVLGARNVPMVFHSAESLTGVCVQISDFLRPETCFIDLKTCAG